MAAKKKLTKRKQYIATFSAPNIMSRISMLIDSVQHQTEQSQMKTFTAWMNYHLMKQEMKVEDLAWDLRDGVVLAKFLEVLIGEEVKKIRKNPKLRIQMIENCNIDLEFMKTHEVQFFNVSGEDIVDGNLKLILGLMWSIARTFQIGGKKKETKPETSEDDLHLRAQEESSPISNSDSEIRDMLIKFLCEVTGKTVTNLKEDLVDGDVLATMVENMIKLSRKGDGSLVELSSEPEELMRVILTLDAAEKYLKIPALIEPEDLVAGKVDEKSIMLFLSLFKNLYDNKQHLESLSIVETDLPITATTLNVEEQLASIDRKKNAFDFGGGFASVDLNSDIIGMDENFLKIDGDEGENNEPQEAQQKRLRNPYGIQKQEDEDAELLEVLVREQRQMAERKRQHQEEEERKRLEEELRFRLQRESEEEELRELERIEREKEELALRLAMVERDAMLKEEEKLREEERMREEKRRMEEERLRMEEELRRLEEEAAEEERQKQLELEERMRLEETLLRAQEEAQRMKEEKEQAEELRRILEQQEEEERLRREAEIESMEAERLRLAKEIEEEEWLLHEQAELDKLEQERLRLEREFEEELAREMNGIDEAHQQEVAPQVPEPVQNKGLGLPTRDARYTMKPQNLPVGGDWFGSVYMVAADPNATYVPAGVQAYKEESSLPPPKTGIAGFFGSTKDFGTRIGKELGHMFEEDNNHATHQRFVQFFKFVHPEPLFTEFACKFASGEGNMVIGFGYVTRNFLCLNGGNARDQISIIIPLVDIRKIEAGISSGILSKYSATPKIVLASQCPGQPANAICVFDIFNQVHRVYSVSNPDKVINILTIRWKEAVRLGALDNSIQLREDQKQVNSMYETQRPVAPNIHEKTNAPLPPLPPRSGPTDYNVLPPPPLSAAYCPPAPTPAPFANLPNSPYGTTNASLYHSTNGSTSVHSSGSPYNTNSPCLTTPPLPSATGFGHSGGSAYNSPNPSPHNSIYTPPLLSPCSTNSGSPAPPPRPSGASYLTSPSPPVPNRPGSDGQRRSGYRQMMDNDQYQ